MPETLAVPDPAASRDHVTRVTQGALQDAASGRAVPAALVRALAEGQGNPREVAELSRQLFGAGAKPLDLVLFDTDRIASFVFESSRPPVLAGASKILRELNSGIAESYREQTIFSGGGEGLLLVPAGRGAAVCEQIRRRFASQTGGALGVTVDFLPVAPEEFLSSPGEEAAAVDGVRLVSGTQAVLARLRDHVRAEKDRRLPARRQVAGDRARCVSCRDREAGEAECPRQGLDGQAEGRLCEPCRLRWQEGRRLIAGDSFEDLVERFRQAIGGTRAPGAKSSYLGLLYADGNAMGNLFGRLRSLAELRFASTAVGHVFATAADFVETEVRKTVAEERIFLSLLGGGDEAIWILPGALAVRVAEQLEIWIDRAAEAIPGLASLLADAGTPKLTFGAGLVLCDPGFPVRYQYELASALLKSAKGMFHGVDRSRISSSIDFAVLTDSSPLSEDLASARALSYRTAETSFLRTCRPYTYEGFAALLGSARRAKEAKLGKSQLYALQSGAAEGRKIFLNHLRYQIARKPAGPRYQAWMEGTAFEPGGIESFFLRDLSGGPGRETGRETQGTWIPDLLELSPFLDLLESEA